MDYLNLLPMRFFHFQKLSLEPTLCFIHLEPLVFSYTKVQAVEKGNSIQFGPSTVNNQSYREHICQVFFVYASNGSL
jgi:hypothetical protein